MVPKNSTEVAAVSHSISKKPGCQPTEYHGWEKLIIPWQREMNRQSSTDFQGSEGAEYGTARRNSCHSTLSKLMENITLRVA